jgi:6-phosphogluconolactonase
MTSLLIGTYTGKLAHVDGKADGILQASYRDGRAENASAAAKVTNPSWLCVSSDGTNVYAVIETAELNGEPGGGAIAFRRDPTSGALTALNTVHSRGVEPAHITLDPTETYVIETNYKTGSVSVFGRETDGSLGPMVDHVQHQGSSSHQIRQAGPHIHQTLFDPKTGLAVIPDFGMDAVLFYELGPNGNLTEERSMRLSTNSGAGPRHLAFHPGGEYLFVITELDNTLIVLRRKGNGFVQTDVKSTLPHGFSGHSEAAAVRVSQSGQFVFGSNCEHDSIAMFRFDSSMGTVDLVHVEPTLGTRPRDFVLSPDGSHLVVANQNSDNIVTFAIDEVAAKLEPVGTSRAETPVCLVFV